MPVKSTRGQSPLIIALPYIGTHIPAVVSNRLTETGLKLDGTDYYLDRFLPGLSPDISTVGANFHRFVSDANHDQTAVVSNPNFMGVVPLKDPSGKNIWITPPTASEASLWRSMFYTPFHAALRAQLARIRAQHGFAVLLTLKTQHNRGGNSQPSTIEMATRLAQSDTVDLAVQSLKLFKAESVFQSELSGDMQNAGITKEYGKSGRSVHAIQLSIPQEYYLSAGEEPEQFEAHKAEVLAARLDAVTKLLINFKPA